MTNFGKSAPNMSTFLHFFLLEMHLNIKHEFEFLHRVKILKEKALPEIENYMFEEHDQIRQAATECMCNLVCCKEV